MAGNRKGEGRTARVTVLLSPAMLRRVRRMAGEMGVSVSSLVAMAVGEYVSVREASAAARAVRDSVMGGHEK